MRWRAAAVVAQGRGQWPVLGDKVHHGGVRAGVTGLVDLAKVIDDYPDQERFTL